MMRLFGPGLGACLAGLALAGCAAVGGGAAPPSTTPARLSEPLRSIPDIIRTNGRVEVLHVHGMGASGPGGAKWLTDALCGGAPDGAARRPRRTGGPDCRVSPQRRYDLTVGAWQNGDGAPPRARFFTEEIWSDEDDWRRSRPYLTSVTVDGVWGQVIVHELNYWPLLQPVKCRFLVGPDSRLYDARSALMETCEKQGWPAPTQLRGGDAGGRAHGLGSGLLNRMLKSRLLNWGMADAVMKTGPIGGWLDETVEDAVLCMAGVREQVCDPVGAAAPVDADQRGRGTAPAYVVVTESLGGFVTFDALAVEMAESAENQKPADDNQKRRREIFERINTVYMLANQISILFAGRVHLDEVQPDTTDATPAEGLRALSEIARPGEKLQVIAFHDPSDALTYELPEVDESERMFVNVYVRNAYPWLGLIAHPGYAHLDYWKNPAVRRIMFGDNAPASQPAGRRPEAPR